MANPFNGCSRGVFAVWMPAELSTTQFSMLKPDSTISVGYDPEHTFTTDRSSLQKMETIDSDGSSIRETAMKTFEGCHRGVFALDSWITGDADRFERSSSPPDISTDPHPKIGSHGMVVEELQPCGAWDTPACKRGVFAVRQLWDASYHGNHVVDSLSERSKGVFGLLKNPSLNQRSG